jgi:Tfp pilus assembly protein PilV
MMSQRSKNQQRGVTLVIALIVLVLMALGAAQAFKGSTNNLRVVGNAQARQELTAAANDAIEQTLSSPLFTTDPTAVAAAPIPVDIDGDNISDAEVQLSPIPKCYRVKAIKESQLDVTLASDRSCMKGSGGNTGIDNGTLVAGDSLCSETEWSLRAVVQDAKTGAQVAANQGVAVRVLSVDASNSCP